MVLGFIHAEDVGGSMTIHMFGAYFGLACSYALGGPDGTEHELMLPDKISDIIALINMDMIGRENIDSIHCIGSNKLSTEFYNIIEETNSKTVKMFLDYRFNDPNDRKRYYYRSDHYEYAKRGIPIVFFFDDMRIDYHRATDDFDKINYSKIARIINLVYNVSIEVANLDHRLTVDKENEDEE